MKFGLCLFWLEDIVPEDFRRQREAEANLKASTILGAVRQVFTTAPQVRWADDSSLLTFIQLLIVLQRDASDRYLRSFSECSSLDSGIIPGVYSLLT